MRVFLRISSTILCIQYRCNGPKIGMARGVFCCMAHAFTFTPEPQKKKKVSFKTKKKHFDLNAAKQLKQTAKKGLKKKKKKKKGLPALSPTIDSLFPSGLSVSGLFFPLFSLTLCHLQTSFSFVPPSLFLIPSHSWLFCGKPSCDMKTRKTTCDKYLNPHPLSSPLAEFSLSN